MQRRKITIAVSALCLACIPAMAQPGSLSNSDKQFMTMAARANMTEAHLGQMAEAQASGDGVKGFAQTLAQDHTKAYEELCGVSSKTGESIPNGIDTAKDSAIRELARLKGMNFDRRFLQHEIQDHEKAIAAFKHEAEHGENPAVKDYAQKMVPILEQHLQKAQELAKAERRG